MENFPFQDYEQEVKIIEAIRKKTPQAPRLGALDESVALYELAAGFHDSISIEGYCVEFGTFAGGSAIIIAAALQKYQPICNVLFAVDPYAWRAEVLPIAHRAFQRLGLDKHVCQILYPDLDFIRQFWKLPARFFHLDSEHDYNHVKHQLNLCFPVLLDGGWLAIHDYSESSKNDVVRAVDEFVDSNRSRLSVFRVKGLVLLRKEE
jgi:predicted O-methyltransferase YrrM